MQLWTCFVTRKKVFYPSRTFWPKITEFSQNKCSRKNHFTKGRWMKCFHKLKQCFDFPSWWSNHAASQDNSYHDKGEPWKLPWQLSWHPLSQLCGFSSDLVGVWGRHERERKLDFKNLKNFRLLMHLFLCCLQYFLPKILL